MATKIVSQKDYDEIECPGCGDKIHLKKAPASHTIVTNESLPTTELEALIGKEVEKRVPKKEEKEKEMKIEKEIEYPSYMPGEYCASGNCELGGVHPNKNYKRKAQKKCRNCDQFAPKNAPRCAWCGEDEFAAMDDEDLENMGIKLPNIEGIGEHEHTH